MLVVAIGQNSNEVYAYGKYRSEVMRQLDKKHPFQHWGENDPRITGTVYPEPIILRKVKSNALSTLQSKTK